MDMNKFVENDYASNKLEYPKNITAGHILFLNYQHNYNSNRKSRSQYFSNQFIFSHHGKKGYDDSETKD